MSLLEVYVMIPSLDPDLESDFQPFGDSRSGFGSRNKWNRNTSSPYLNTWPNFFVHSPHRPTTPPPPPPPQPSFANPFGLPPYFAHFLPTATSAAAASAASLHSANSDAESVADSNSDSAAGSPVVPSSSSALDLSPNSVNVVDSVEDWSVDQVVAFVRGVEGCEEYAEVINDTQ